MWRGEGTLLDPKGGNERKSRRHREVGQTALRSLGRGKPETKKQSYYIKERSKKKTVKDSKEGFSRAPHQPKDKERLHQQLPRARVGPKPKPRGAFQGKGRGQGTKKIQPGRSQVDKKSPRNLCKKIPR